jgi:DNA (cytosine-5)-methyltransferase 1
MQDASVTAVEGGGNPPPSKLAAVGVTAGIGSMLAAAREAGFKVLGNIEWREFAHARDFRGQNTFRMNFPGAPFVAAINGLLPEQVEQLRGATLAVGQPECGRYSALDATNKIKKGGDARAVDPSDIPLFVKLVAKLRPRYVIMDDLPKSLLAFPMSEYASRLPDYDLFPEWIGNFFYGNAQKNRNRFFMIGALKSEGFVFAPGEDPSASQTLRDVIGDLCDEAGEPVGNFLNHRSHVVDAACANATGLISPGRRSTWREVQEYMARQPSGHALKYFHRTDGSVKTKIGFTKTHWDGGCHVLDGGSPTIHPVRNLPLTIRERARIQGFPDDFAFYGEVADSDLRWDHYKNNALIKQTGKCIPLQFVKYASSQIAAHVNGEKFQASGLRVLPPNEHVDEAKRWFCNNIGYADQKRACASCWLSAGCTIRAVKYAIGEPSK